MSDVSYQFRFVSHTESFAQHLLLNPGNFFRSGNGSPSATNVLVLVIKFTIPYRPIVL